MPKPSQPPGKNKKDIYDPPPPEPTPSPTPQPDPTFNGRIVVDPITRIEGHLKIETEVVDGKVTEAWSTGTLFRGIEMILKGRNPEDAWLFTQRLCGVCTYVHGSTSVRCVEDAAGVTIPENARIIRNLLMGAQYLHDHIVHFYHLHAPDWVDIPDALQADLKATSNLATDISPETNPSIEYFAAVQEKLKLFISSGQLGPFANAYWGHQEYFLSEEENLLLAAHYLEALKMQAQTARMHAIFGGKNPHVQSLRVGGVTCQREINNNRIAEFLNLLRTTRTFVENYYLPDVKLLAKAYGYYASIGGCDNFLAVGEFPGPGPEPDSLFFPRGVIFNRGPVEPLNVEKIVEHISHSWYQGDTPLHPSVGVTTPGYTGMNTADRYSWLKAPRYNGWPMADGQPMEVGPLARVLVAYKSGQPQVVKAVNDFLGQTGLGVNDLCSTLGRTAARALETQVIAAAMEEWLGQLAPGGSAFRSVAIPASGMGVAFNEAPRGALGHWINIQDQKIANYQMVVPSTWNFGPRCANNLAGPAEQALVGIPVLDASKPLEILRTVHSLDPCIACAVHVIDPENDRAYEIKVL
jgi:[NiFe] hydrogenase large subunit